MQELTRGVMADRVVLTPGVLHAELLAPALMLTRKGGTCLMTGVPQLEVSMVPLMLSDILLSCKDTQGAAVRRPEPRASMPMLLSMYRNGHLKLDELVTKRYRLDQINDAFTDMRRTEHPRHHRIRLGATDERLREELGATDERLREELGATDERLREELGA